MPAMSSADAAWLRMDRPTNPMVITSVLWFERPLSIGALRDVLAERLVGEFPRFAQRPVVDGVLGGAHWEDDPDFDLDLHLHHVALPAPGDAAALRALVGDLVAMPLERSRPLWSFTLVDGYGEGCAVLARMHHAIADGIALARVMLLLTDGDPGAAQVSPEAPHDHDRGVLPPAVGEALGLGRRATEAAIHEAAETLVHPKRLGALARTAARDAQIVAKLLGNPPDPRTPLHDRLGPGQRVGWSPPLDLEEVRRVGHAFGATVNDVLVAALAGVIGDDLRARGGAPDEVHAMVPFNLRPLDRPLPRDLGNRFGLILLELPVGIESPVTRLLEVQRRTSGIKDSHEGEIAYGILSAMGTTPPDLEAWMVDLFSAKATMVVTNVPGPRSTISLAGVPLGGVLVWAPCSGSVGMSVSVFSYRGEVTIGFLVNRRLTGDPQALAEAMPRALRDLAEETTTGRR